MKRIILSMFCTFCLSEGLTSQNIVRGIVKEHDSEKPLQGVFVSIEGTTTKQQTDALGFFSLENLLEGKQLVTFKKEGYEPQIYPITLTGTTIDLEIVSMYLVQVYEVQDMGTITITDDELNSDTNGADNISGLLQSSKDIYLRTAAFEFSSSFFSVRGLDSENGTVLINGVEMNKLYTGRPQWSNWGGLNNVFRNQEFTNGLDASSYTFGGVLGTTHISTRASEYKAGNSVSYASSNRSYVHRAMATYASGLTKHGWAFAFSGSRRAATEGFVEGASYNAYSMFAAVEKKIDDRHSINVTAIYAANRRGKSAGNTQEIYDLKGIQYNPYWGYQNGIKRNARIKEVKEPIVMLNHYWNLSDKTSLSSGVSYQFGGVGNSRIDFGGAAVENTVLDGNGNPFVVRLGGSNPDPTYYQNLPSYALRQGFSNIYETEQAFLNDGQLNWNQMYTANLAKGSYASYVLYEDRNEDKKINFNTILESQLSENIILNASLQYTSQKSENFATILDLLGGTGYLDVDNFADTFDSKQNNLLNPLYMAAEGDRFKYNFNLNSEVYTGFAQAQFNYKTIDFFLAANISSISHEREGFYQNGKYPDNSLGKSGKKVFTNVGLKGGFTYKLNGRNLFNFNAGYVTKAPTLRNIFSNSRENNNVVIGVTNEKILSGDASYILRTPKVQAKATAYYTKIAAATAVSFYYADGIREVENATAFVQQVMTGIDKQHIGVELGLEAQVTAVIKLKGAANIGQYTYANNPNIYLTSSSIGDDEVLSYGTSNLKNYKLSGGPQKAYSVGFEYRDPDYWWFGATANFFNEAYVAIAPLTRTSYFSVDPTGSDNNNLGDITFNDYDESIARELLQQEKFENYMVVNLVGGKSWSIGKGQYIGLFASIGNVLNQAYKTGGYEQGRNANYRELRDDKALNTRVFGNKYWYGRGTTYFVNINYRF